ncbi:Zinc finger, CCHC-type [Sesbania bispinosa]|nr:Zinc finger, CCHC-type [Sesbania bispinosa]
MPPRTRISARREALVSLLPNSMTLFKGVEVVAKVDKALMPEVRQIDKHLVATVGGIKVTLVEFMKLKPPTFSGSNASEDPQWFIDGLERLWSALGYSDIKAVELAYFQLEGVAYDWFDTVTRGRSIGSPPLVWGEFNRLFMARFLPENVRDGHAPYPITEQMRVKRFVRGLREYIFRSVVGSNCSTFAEVLSNDRRRKKAVVRILARNSGLRDQRVVTQVLVWDPCPVIRVCYQCVQTGHIMRDCPVVVTQPSSSHASASAALASSLAPSALIRGQAQAGRGQARVFAMTRRDAQASNAVVTGILSICSQDAHVLFDSRATHSFVSLSFATQLGKCSSSLDETLAVTTPVGEILLADCVFHSCVASIRGRKLLENLIALDMVDFDVILGMELLAYYYATLDCHNKVVKFEMPRESAFSF